MAPQDVTALICGTNKVDCLKVLQVHIIPFTTDILYNRHHGLFFCLTECL